VTEDREPRNRYWDPIGIDVDAPALDDTSSGDAPGDSPSVEDGVPGGEPVPADGALTDEPAPEDAPDLDERSTESPDVPAPADADHHSMDAVLAPPKGWTDPLTGIDGPRYWDRVVSSERARVTRYGRSATVVLVDVVGLEALAAQWGPDVAVRAFIRLARTLSREVRSSDHIARIEPMRFGIMLTETDEIAAINFVERARTACQCELGLASEFVHVGFGWASPSGKADLSSALDAAAERVLHDLDHPA
jgi:diguanylate cyclase (GGDEF)-like protein